MKKNKIFKVGISVVLFLAVIAFYFSFLSPRLKMISLVYNHTPEEIMEIKKKEMEQKYSPEEIAEIRKKYTSEDIDEIRKKYKEKYKETIKK